MTSREQFEQYMLSLGRLIVQRVYFYEDPDVAFAWEVWKESRK